MIVRETSVTRANNNNIISNRICSHSRTDTSRNRSGSCRPLVLCVVGRSAQFTNCAQLLLGFRTAPTSINEHQRQVQLQKSNGCTSQKQIVDASTVCFQQNCGKLIITRARQMKSTERKNKRVLLSSVHTTRRTRVHGRVHAAWPRASFWTPVSTGHTGTSVYRALVAVTVVRKGDIDVLINIQSKSLQPVIKVRGNAGGTPFLDPL